MRLDLSLWLAGIRTYRKVAPSRDSKASVSPDLPWCVVSEPLDPRATLRRSSTKFFLELYYASLDHTLFGFGLSLKFCLFKSMFVICFREASTYTLEVKPSGNAT